ncbi:hypothetical protein [Singulisphaera acidiphila]|uniref:Uncharacterized protein n=1 Tax=Singulisphaera acidiphila (strain ATCC BAA-1392 / DSM 18658 / VKM B-2454 / MOB10) TaxID=886293 RepID=L0DRL6_SINAD|nr:hypothetical protein [Singulisphaera acidiphila]AGA31640.1 hypothetical protein Sinac_7609 [Singulisphaera acidiphila DSM 18658]
MATAKTTRSLRVTCPFCADADATLTLDLNDLGVISCSGCDETFSAQLAYDKAAELATRWSQVVAWVDSAPVV